MQNYFLTICLTSKSDAGLEDAARNIRAVCTEKKGEKKHEHTRAGYIAAILWMAPLYLGIHQSGIMRAAWLEMRDFDEIKCVVNRGLNMYRRDEIIAMDNVCSHTSI